MTIPHPRFDEFFATLGAMISIARPFKGILYRACDPSYANTRDLLSGEGSRRFGGRWNAPGSFATTYLAQDIHGAIAETLGVASRYGFDFSSRLPLTLAAVDADLDTVFDLTDKKIRKDLGITLYAMNQCDWRGENAAGREAVTQALGRAAFEIGAHGVVVPSAVKRTYRNLNIFPANLAVDWRLKIRKPEKLPAPPK